MGRGRIFEYIQDAVEAGGHSLRDTVEDVGRKYRELVENTPDILTYRKPAVLDRAIENQYGVELSRGPSTFSNGRSVFLRPTKGSRQAELELNTSDYFRKLAADDFQPELAAAIPNRQVLGALHALELERNSGGGGAVYPAMFDLLARGNALNVSDNFLTPINQWRKPFANTVPSMIRHGKNLVIPHPSSLRHTGTSPAEYMSLDLDSQIGENLINGGLGLYRHIANNTADAQRLLATRRGFAEMDPEEISAWAQLQDSFAPSYGEYGISASSTAGEIEDRAKLLQQAGISSVGPSSLKRMLVLDALSQDSPLPDLSMLKGMEKRCGGLVQTHARRPSK